MHRISSRRTHHNADPCRMNVKPARSSRESGHHWQPTHRCRARRKRYGDTVALDDVSLNVRAVRSSASLARMAQGVYSRECACRAATAECGNGVPGMILNVPAANSGSGSASNSGRPSPGPDHGSGTPALCLVLHRKPAPWQPLGRLGASTKLDARFSQLSGSGLLICLAPDQPARARHPRRADHGVSTRLRGESWGASDASGTPR